MQFVDDQAKTTKHVIKFMFFGVMKCGQNYPLFKFLKSEGQQICWFGQNYHLVKHVKIY